MIAVAGRHSVAPRRRGVTQRPTRGVDHDADLSRGGFAHHGRACPCISRGPAHAGDRTDRIPHRGGSVRDPGDPSLADEGLSRHACRHGSGGERQHAGNGNSRLGRRILQPQNRPAAGDPAQPGSAFDPDGVARVGARPHHLRTAAHRARRVHGHGFRTDAGIFGRSLQRRGHRRRVRRLRHRQCRQQSHRAADLRRCRRPLGPGDEFLRVRGAQSRGRGFGVFHDQSHQADGRGGAGTELAVPARSPM